MKRNAITRIIIWSVVIVVLLAAMCAIMFDVSRSRHHMYTDFASVTSPIEAVEVVPDETSVYVPVSNERSTFSASEVREIEIEWVAGDILIQPHDTDTITVRQDGTTDSSYAMVYSCKDGKLKIQFCEDSVMNKLNIGFNTTVSKDLTIYVPRDWECKSLEIDAASANVEVNDMVIREVEIDTASGTCAFENCTVGEIDIDSASGDVRFIGSLDILECDAASANVYAVLSNVPSRLDMDSMSGDLDITLPTDAGFTLRMDAMKSDFSSDFETALKNGSYVCGDGACRINVDAMSGNVIIRMDTASIAPTVTETPEEPETPEASEETTTP